MRVRLVVPDPLGGESPVAGQPVVALPYDRDSVLTALERRAPRPRPNTTTLDSLFRLMQEPFVAYAQTSFRADRLRDSLNRIRQRLDSIPRGDSSYARLYRRFADLTDSAAAVDRIAIPQRSRLEAVSRRLLPTIERLRLAMRRWEDSAFRSYEEIVKSLAGGRAPVADSTGPDGTTTLTLGKGRWWIYARAWDASAPYTLWYWNLPVEGDSLVLDQRNAVRKPRY